MAARRHFLMTLRNHLAADVAHRSDDGHGQRAKFLFDHLELYLPREDARLVDELEAVMRGEVQGG